MSARNALQQLLGLMALVACALHVNATPHVYLYFEPVTVPEGNSSTPVLQISDDTTLGFTGGAIAVDAFTYPVGLVNDVSSVQSNTCGGTPVATAGAGSMYASGMSVGSFGACMIRIGVTAPPGTYIANFPIDALTTSSGNNPSGSAGTLYVVAPIVVSNTSDSGAGSLRDAIDRANGSCPPGTTITFGIPGTGPFTIQPGSQLPVITCAVFIDGYKQPGSAPNTDAGGGNNASIQVILNGASCSGCVGFSVASMGGGTTIRGLAIVNFSRGPAIEANGPIYVYGNYVGTDPGGMTPSPNGAGIGLQQGISTIGSFDPADRNLISGNTGGGIVINSGAAAEIYNNQIGGRRDGSSGMPNSLGVLFSGASYSRSYVQKNYIRYNNAQGVAMIGSFSSPVILSFNAIHGNGLAGDGTGFDLLRNGPTPNDEAGPPYDTDSGPNNLMNYPVVTSVMHSGSDTIITGYIKTEAGSGRNTVNIEFFHNNVMSPTTEGELPLGGPGLALDSTGYATFTYTLFGFLAENVSAMASVDACGDGCVYSSEYSPKVAASVASSRWVVVNTNDSGPGSLRDSIEYSNTGACASKRATSKTTGSAISFNIPGSGPHTIQPLTPYPTLTCDGLSIDAFTQPGSRPNIQGVGDDAIRLIELNGALAPVLTNGLQISAANVTIRGLVITDFASNAAIMVSTPRGLTGPGIFGNIIGTDATGSARKKNAYGVLNTASATGMGIGSASPGDRNIISGNDIGIQIQSGDVNAIENNYIGVNPAGNAAQSNDTGMIITGGTNLRIVSNTISGNGSDGVWLRDSTGTTVQGNKIGIDASAVSGVRNGGNGLNFDAGAFGSVGPDNTIAYNGSHGVRVASTGVQIRANRIYLNGGLGIELNNGGVLPANDSCDADTGGNNWQNYPVITSVTIYSDYMNVTGTFDSTGGRTFGLDFYENGATDAPSNRAGRFLLGSALVATTLTPSCATPFSVDLAAVVSPGALVTATATDLTTGDTSGFSAAVSTPVPGPAVTLAPTSLTFGGQVVNTSSTAQQVTLTNSGTAALAIASMNTGSHFSFTTTCGPSLAAGASCTVDVTFTPTVVAPISTALLVTTDAPGSPHRVNLSGTGMAAAAPLVTLAPTTLTFSPQLIATSSATQPVTLTNSGSASLTVSAIAASGDFSQANACPATIAAGASCTINVKFTPTAPGARSGTLSVTSNATGSPHGASLSGTGVTPAPAVSLAPSSLTFAARTVGTTSTAQTITLANTGSLVLNIASISATGDFAFTSGCGKTLAPGASCTIDVTFTPLVVGSRTGTLTILDDAAGSPHTVSLAGTGLSTSAPVADISPPLIDFAAQPVGHTSAAELLTVTNSGNASLTFSSIGISGEFALVPPATAGTALQCPVTLAPGTSCEIRVTFHPAGPNLREGLLTMVTNAGTIKVRVMGTGLVPAPPQLSLISSLAFGNQPIGTRSAGRPLAIRNTSEVFATITELSTLGDFSVSDTCAIIAAGATCSPLVTFEPTALGPRAGTLTVRTLRDADPYTVSLTGTGEENRLPVLQLSATSMGFGNTFLGQPVTREVTVRNSGTAPLIISSIVAGAGFFSDTVCIATLAAGSSCTVHVTFLPGLPGSQAALLEIVSNAAGSPHHVGLSGTGCFLPTPARARFGGLICGP